MDFGCFDMLMSNSWYQENFDIFDDFGCFDILMSNSWYQVNFDIFDEEFSVDNEFEIHAENSDIQIPKLQYRDNFDMPQYQLSHGCKFASCV